MYYEVYVDSLFLLHFTLNLYLLQLVNISLCRTATRRRILAGSAFAAVGGCAIMLFPLGFVVLKPICTALADGLVLWWVFKPGGRRAFFRLAEKMVLFGWLIGGIFLLLRTYVPLAAVWQKTTLGILLSGGILFLFFSHRIVGEKRKEEGICKAELVGKDGGRIQVNAIVDTGNSLREPISGKPVCVLDQESFGHLFKEEPELFRVIPYHSVGCDKGIMKGYEIEELVIEQEGVRKTCRNAYVGVSKTQVAAGAEYQLLIHPALLTDRKSG